MSDRWYLNYRMQWIEESVRIFGFINREHVMKKFGLSRPQASHDLQEAMKRNPRLMFYNINRKRYEVMGDGDVQH